MSENVYNVLVSLEEVIKEINQMLADSIQEVCLIKETVSSVSQNN